MSQMKTITKSLCSAVGVACVALLTVTAVAQPEPTPAESPPAQLPATQPADSVPPAGEPLNPPADGTTLSAQSGPGSMPADQSGEGYSALENGPVHEAFAEQYSLEAPEPFVIQNEPPPPIDELPPEVKPEGAIWVPGYWTWLEEQNDFVWVSGVWRIPPPGRQWVPGHWSDVDNGFQWTAGFWAPGETEELAYLPPPPETLEVGPSSPAPSVNHFWVPGCWTWNTVDYSWQPGHWHQAYDNWLWMPSRFFYTPRGYIRLGGYWDRPFARRGLWFAPVHFHRPIYRNPGFFFRPRAFINIGFLTINIYRSPNRGYFYGNYAGPRFANAGFVPWFGLGSGRHYDPFFAYESLRRGRTNPNWINDLRRDYRQLADASTDFNRDRNRLDRLDGPGRFNDGRFNDGPFGDRIIRDVSLLDPGRTRDFEALRDIRLDRVSQNEIRQAVERSFDRVSQIREQREQIESRIRDRVNQDRPDTDRPDTDRPGRGPRDRDDSLPGNDGPGNDRPGNDRPGNDRPDNDRPDNDRPGNDRPGNNRPGSDGPNNDVPGNDRPGNDGLNNDRPGSDRPGNDRPGNDRPNNDRPDVDRPGRDSDSPRNRLPGRDPMNNDAGSGQGDNNDRPGTPRDGADRSNPPTLRLPGREGDTPPVTGDSPGRDASDRTGNNDRPGSRLRDRIGNPGSETPLDSPRPGTREGSPGNRLQLPPRDNNSPGGNNPPAGDATRPGLGEGRSETPRLRLPGVEDSNRRTTPNLPGTEGNRLIRPETGNGNRSGNDAIPRSLNRPTPPSLGSPSNDGPANTPRSIPSRPTPQPRSLNVPSLNTPTNPPAGTLRQRSVPEINRGPSTRSLESPAPRITIPQRSEPTPRATPTPRISPPSIRTSPAPRINTPAPAPRIDPTPRQAPAPRIAPPSRPAPAARAPSGRSGGEGPARGGRGGRGRGD